MNDLTRHGKGTWQVQKTIIFTRSHKISDSIKSDILIPVKLPPHQHQLYIDGHLETLVLPRRGIDLFSSLVLRGIVRGK